VFGSACQCVRLDEMMRQKIGASWLKECQEEGDQGGGGGWVQRSFNKRGWRGVLTKGKGGGGSCVPHDGKGLPCSCTDTEKRC